METTEVRCPVDAFERGQLPAVCALSGRPADCSARPSAEHVRREVTAFVDAVEEATGERQAGDRRRRATTLLLGGVAVGLASGPVGLNVAVGLGSVIGAISVG